MLDIFRDYDAQHAWQNGPGLKLNLGCCDRRIEGFTGVDLRPPADQVVDLACPWPWWDNTVVEVLAYDVIEHIGDCDHTQALCWRCWNRRQVVMTPEEWAELSRQMRTERMRHPLGRIHFMNELWRVLKPGAVATIETPNAANGVGYMQDPTHVSPFCMSTFRYFEDGSFARQRLGDLYGITARFRILEMREIPSPAEGFGEQVWKIHAKLEAMK